VLDGNSIITANVSYNSSNNTVTITPVAALTASKTYTISVVGGFQGVKDIAGNPLAQTFTATFTTAAAPPVDTTPPTVSSISPSNGSSNVAVAAPLSVTFSEALDLNSVSASTIKLLRGATLLTANVTYNAATRTATVTPTAALSNSTSYTISVVGGTSGIKDAAGNALLSTVTSTFTTAAATVTPTTIWPSTAKPKVVDVKEADPVELGVKFTADTNGYITGIRFYKAAGNTGTHIANLWTSDGELLATATFTSETASGWQQVNFATPVAITAGTTYVASYFAPNGHFSVDRSYLANGFNSGNLHVPVGGGVFAYGGNSLFPNQSYQNSNYWVDVDFTPAN
jgi:uncharacterized protein DUF4082/Big-like domain-containing protein